jgi:rod shape-determining protein MreC
MFNYLRNKTILNLAVLSIIGSIIGMMHSHEIETGKSLYLQDAVRSTLAPVEMATHALVSITRVAVMSFKPRAVLLKENKQLRERVKQLTRENVRLHELAEENIRLREELGLKQTSQMQVIAAEVISRNESNWFDTATINAGTKDGIKRGSAVINHHGLIGQISDANPFTSHVVALTDSTSAVGAMVQRSRSSGVLQGQGADYLVLAYLPKDADVKIKDIVISSGMGGIIPKGLVVGRVVKVVRNSLAGTTSALVRPSVSFDEVEQVLVIKSRQAQP